MEWLEDQVINKENDKSRVGWSAKQEKWGTKTKLSYLEINVTIKKTKFMGYKYLIEL